MTDFEKYIVGRFGEPVEFARKCWLLYCRLTHRDPVEEEKRLDRIYAEDRKRGSLIEDVVNMMD